MDHMLNPRKVSVPGGRYSVFPPLIVAEFIAAPIGEVEWRICHYEIGFQRRMQIVEERVLMVRSEVRVDAAYRHIHLCHLPSIGVGLLPIHGDISALAAVRLQEFCRLHEHTARSAARVVHAAVIERFENSDDGFDDTRRRVELAALRAFIRRELRDAVFVSAPQKVFAFRRYRPYECCS